MRLVFDNNEEIDFPSPDWIANKYPQQINPDISRENDKDYDSKLCKIREQILIRMIVILQKDDKDGETVSKQSEGASKLLLWMRDVQKGKIQTNTRALTLEGLVAFLLSNGKQNHETTITDKYLTHQEHKIIYRVPTKHSVEIRPKERVIFQAPMPAMPVLPVQETGYASNIDQFIPLIDRSIKLLQSNGFQQEVKVPNLQRQFHINDKEMALAKAKRGVTFRTAESGTKTITMREATLVMIMHEEPSTRQIKAKPFLKLIEERLRAKNIKP